ncbi:MAG: Hsp20/alpha crystallin family protein [Candidatus Bathyarchaeia archaeon]
MPEEVKPKEPGTTLPAKTTTRRMLHPTIRPSLPSFWEEVDRFFDEFRRGFIDLFSPWAAPLAPPLNEIREPCCDLIDEGTAYRMRLEVPGIPKDKIEIHATNNSIEVNAEAATEEEERKGKKVVSRERNYSRLYRCITLPEEVVPEKAEATLKNGLLEIEVPKKTPTPEPKKHRVQIK